MQAPALPENRLVVVVDDESIVCEMVELLLQQHGYQTRAFYNPELVLDQLDSAESPRVLVTDYFMPHLNGLELMSRCRKLWPNIKTILISGGEMMDQLTGSPTQPERFLPKPFAARELLDTIHDLMGGTVSTSQCT